MTLTFEPETRNNLPYPSLTLYHRYFNPAMTFQEFLSKRPDDGILAKLLLKHPQQTQNLSRLIEALQELRNIDLDESNPQSLGSFCTFWTIVHKKEQSDGKPAIWDVAAEGYPILGLDLKVEKLRALPWDSILRRDIIYIVNDETVDIQALTGDEQDDLLAAIIYEMT